MTTLQKIGAGVVVILALLGAVAFFRGSSSSFGAFQQGEVQNNPFIFLNGFSAGSSQQFLVDASGLLTVGKTLTQTTTNTATSTAIFGCVQLYATSTATPIHLEISTTTMLSTFTGGANITSATGGGVAWKYGVCPV